MSKEPSQPTQPSPGDDGKNRISGSDNVWKPLHQAPPPSTSQPLPLTPPTSSTQPRNPNRPGPEEKWRWDGSKSEWKRLYSARDKKLIGTGIAAAALLVLGALGYLLVQTSKNAAFATQFAATEMRRPGSSQILQQMADVGVLQSQLKASRELRTAWLSQPDRPMATAIYAGSGRHCIQFTSSDGATAHALVTFKNIASEVGYYGSYRSPWTVRDRDIAGGGC